MQTVYLPIFHVVIIAFCNTILTLPRPRLIRMQNTMLGQPSSQEVIVVLVAIRFGPGSLPWCLLLRDYDDNYLGTSLPARTYIHSKL
ncbi:hypothetical protein HD806DRAFT_496117 [Xylariaceae sp. AK1471]|nr:hypothetical protein HD806DRAFT_496117 [Xylariaceae sp. AK1471]